MGKSALVYGGCGQLGRVVVEKLRAAGVEVFCADVVAACCDGCVTIDPALSLQLQADGVLAQMGGAKVDLVFVAAGGWAGGAVADDSFLGSVEKMRAFNSDSAAAAAFVAARSLKTGGLLVIMGAAAARGPTPGMIGYGMSKAATHHLVTCLAQPGAGLPADARVVCLLPNTLDTAANRSGMPDADFGAWTPLAFVAETALQWLQAEDVPATGSFLELRTAGGKTSLVAL